MLTATSEANCNGRILPPPPSHRCTVETVELIAILSATEMPTAFRSTAAGLKLAVFISVSTRVCCIIRSIDNRRTRTANAITCRSAVIDNAPARAWRLARRLPAHARRVQIADLRCVCYYEINFSDKQAKSGQQSLPSLRGR